MEEQYIRIHDGQSQMKISDGDWENITYTLYMELKDAGYIIVEEDW